MNSKLRKRRKANRPLMSSRFNFWKTIIINRGGVYLWIILLKSLNLLPFSPVKDLTSPLADLHKAGRNIIGNIRDGMADAAANVNFHTPVGMAAAPATAGGGSYSFSPHVEINVQGGSSPRETAQLTKSEIERMFPRLMDDFFRRAGRKG